MIDNANIGPTVAQRIEWQRVEFAAKVAAADAAFVRQFYQFAEGCCGGPRPLF